MLAYILLSQSSKTCIVNEIEATLLKLFKNSLKQMGNDSWNEEIVEFSVEALLECGNQWSTSQESGEEGSALQYRTLPYLSTLNFAGSNPAFLHIYPRLLVFFFTP
jgi:hypothetical protein